MAKDPAPDEAAPQTDATVVTTTTAPAPNPAPAPVAATKSNGLRWTLASIAAAGLLCLGLLGGILIGQQMARPGIHNAGAPNGTSLQQGGPGQHQRIPDSMKERMKERVKEQLQERRDKHKLPGQPGDTSPTPAPNAPNSGTPGNNG